ncbi:putative membrane protein YhhN [Naumannella cuiyingiana]|uniref:Putative membrane protein YhhN n=1 Tax=Naumannella cuiyingiana TaxID=1347891 RepID=A0A7Z0D8B7_9ACTN|nr:putative membrane protein YhhN [Naumannella cuiyingiana]
MSYAAAWAAYWITAAAHLTFQLLGLPTAAAISQVLLVPCLIVAVATSRTHSSPLRNWMLAALFFSWVGDALPKLLPPSAEIYAMIGGFFVAQLCWMIGLWRLRERSLIMTARWQLPIYLIAGMVLIGILVPTAGVLVPAVAAYGVVVIAMAVLASGLGRIGQLGGIIFLISDALIAFDRFAPWLDIPLAGPAIMATYILAQALLVTATLRYLRNRPARSRATATTLRR